MGCFEDSRRRALAELPTKEWRRVLSVNLDGAFFTLRAAARHMAQRSKAGEPGGRLVGMASSAAIHGAARASAYAASKGAMLSMIRALAVEMARHQVTANSILPGWIESDMTAKAGDEKFAAAVPPRIPMRRWGTRDSPASPCT
jgi:NAD(P)-dependent dehydrogenase (short-subunit alcohol dehydrogenase family)